MNGCKDCTRRHVGCHADCPDYVDKAKTYQHSENILQGYARETSRRLIKKYDLLRKVRK